MCEHLIFSYKIHSETERSRCSYIQIKDNDLDTIYSRGGCDCGKNKSAGLLKAIQYLRSEHIIMALTWPKGFLSGYVFWYKVKKSPISGPSGDLSTWNWSAEGGSSHDSWVVVPLHFVHGAQEWISCVIQIEGREMLQEKKEVKGEREREDWGLRQSLHFRNKMRKQTSGF